MLQEDIVLQVGQRLRPQRKALDLHWTGIRLDEGEDFRADIEMAHDQQVCVRRREGFQTPVNEAVQRPWQVRPVQEDAPDNVDQHEKHEHEGPQKGQQETPRIGVVPPQQRRLGVIVDRQAGIEPQRQPRIRVLRIEIVCVEILAETGGHYSMSPICMA